MKYFKYILFLVILIAIFAFFLKDKNENKKVVILNKEPEVLMDNLIQEEGNQLEQAEGQTVKTDENDLPDKKIIDVPFTSQAPNGVWDIRHDEACEEASLVMIYYFLQNKKITKAQAETEIQSLVDFQIKEYGDFKDSDAAQIVDMAEKFYGINNLEIIYDFKKEEIKKELAKGNPIIVPAAGRVLKNPNFVAPGPLYHAMVLIGYDGDKIVANDPGTRKGASYVYDLDVIYDAIHDFTGKKEDILKGRKAMIIVK